MFRRVTADLSFTSEDEANDFYHDCLLALPKSSIINPHHPNEERGFIRLQVCYHDQTPPDECDVLAYQQTPYST